MFKQCYSRVQVSATKQCLFSLTFFKQADSKILCLVLTFFPLLQVISTMALMEAVYSDILSSPELTVILSFIQTFFFSLFLDNQKLSVLIDQRPPFNY